jgi:hypothetical protein
MCLPRKEFHAGKGYIFTDTAATPQPGEVVMCEYCALGYHLRCANPPLANVPEGEWTCNSCMEADLVWAKVCRESLFARVLAK